MAPSTRDPELIRQPKEFDSAMQEGKNEMAES